ncbi:unnamed protein product [Alternaria alternata]
MALSISDHCRSCIISLQEVISILSQPDRSDNHVKPSQVCEELNRFGLFIGNIGALHRPESPLSIESRLQDANDVLIHILGLLADLNNVTAELLDIVSGKREGMVTIVDDAEEEGEVISEANGLQEEISETITRLFRVSILIRQAAPIDIFAKALSRNRYHFSDQFDIAHVGEKYRKLATEDYAWLRQRLGRAITQRRHYLSYIHDHRENLGGTLKHHDKADSLVAKSKALVIEQPLDPKPMLDTESRPSFFTKATTVAAERITPQLHVAGDSDPDEDARSYTTVSRSMDGDHESSANIRIPKLDTLRADNKNEFECPFCFRIKKFKSERIWRKHIFSDLRPYVCTFPDCDAPYFGDINEWFHHEMTLHRVTYNCFLCQKVYYQEEKYLSHLRQEHGDTLDDGGAQVGTDLARKPLAQIPASGCPCCSDWADRLKERIIQTSGSAPIGILAVTPTVFKRHLAAHLEQLALFAVPIAAATDDNKDSNVAIEEARSKRTNTSQVSALTFPSSQGDFHDSSSETEINQSRNIISQADTQGNEIHRQDVIKGTPSLPSDSGEKRDQDSSVKTPIKLEQVSQLQNIVKANMKTLGHDHRLTLVSMHNLAHTYRSQGRWDKAEKLEVQVTETFKTKMGADHPDTLISMANLALYAASERRDEAVVKKLLDKGAEVNAQGGHYGNALQAASARGHEQIVKTLLDAGADVNAQGGHYGNALQAASEGGHEVILEMLLNHGAEVNAQGGRYGNALQAASARGHEQIVKTLLDAGADVNAQGGYFGNALQAASEGGHEVILEMLLNHGAEVNAQGGRYGNALQAASARGHEQIVKTLLDAGADVNAQGGHYGNALQAASARGHEQIVKTLLDAGADVNAQGGYFGNALQAASEGGHEVILEMLLNYGAEVNAQGGRYGNALQAASARGHEQVAKTLLDAGAHHSRKTFLYRGRNSFA